MIFSAGESPQSRAGISPKWSHRNTYIAMYERKRHRLTFATGTCISAEEFMALRIVRVF